MTEKTSSHTTRTDRGRNRPISWQEQKQQQNSSNRPITGTETATKQLKQADHRNRNSNKTAQTGPSHDRNRTSSKTIEKGIHLTEAVPTIEKTWSFKQQQQQQTDRDAELCLYRIISFVSLFFERKRKHCPPKEIQLELSPFWPAVQFPFSVALRPQRPLGPWGTGQRRDVGTGRSRIGWLVVLLYVHRDH